MLLLGWRAPLLWYKWDGDCPVIRVHGACAGINGNANQTADQEVARGHSFGLRIENTRGFPEARFPAGDVHIVPALGKRCRLRCLGDRRQQSALSI